MSWLCLVLVLWLRCCQSEGVYYFKVITCCEDCLKVERSGRILVNVRLIKTLRGELAMWNPLMPVALVPGVALSIENDLSLRRIEVSVTENYTAVIQYQQMCINGQDDGVTVIRQLLLAMAQNDYLIINPSNSFNKSLFQDSRKVLITRTGTQKQLQQNIHNTIAHNIHQKEDDTLEKSLQIKKSISGMCESQLRYDLLDDYSSILNHQGRPYFNQLLDTLSRRVGAECEKDNTSHAYSIIAMMVVIGARMIQFVKSRMRHKRRMSSI